MQKLPGMSRGMHCGPLARRHQMGNRPLIWVAVAAVTLAGCGSGGNSGGSSTPQHLRATVGITSPDFKPGGRLPRDETCDGAGRKPSLAIGPVPRGTKSLALIMHDPDAPAGDFTHWMVYDISPRAKSPSGTEGQNDLGKVGYAPACPPT